MPIARSNSCSIKAPPDRVLKSVTTPRKPREPTGNARERSEAFGNKSAGQAPFGRVRAGQRSALLRFLNRVSQGSNPAEGTNKSAGQQPISGSHGYDAQTSDEERAITSKASMPAADSSRRSGNLGPPQTVPGSMCHDSDYRHRREEGEEACCASTLSLGRAARHGHGSGHVACE
jgi:hypothetical protein